MCIKSVRQYSGVSELECSKIKSNYKLDKGYIGTGTSHMTRVHSQLRNRSPAEHPLSVPIGYDLFLELF